MLRSQVPGTHDQGNKRGGRGGIFVDVLFSFGQWMVNEYKFNYIEIKVRIEIQDIQMKISVLTLDVLVYTPRSV